MNQSVDIIDSDERTDELVAALAEPDPERRSWSDSVATFFRDATATPRAAAAMTAWWFCVLILLSAVFSQAHVSVRTSLGTATATCGLDVFVYGHPDRAVERACRHAESGRLALFIVTGLIVLAGLVAAVVVAARGCPARAEDDPIQAEPGAAGSKVGRWAMRSPAQPIAAAVMLISGIVALMSLRPVPLDLSQGGSLTTVRCGSDTYFGGYPDKAVQSACKPAFTTQARVLEAALIVFLLALVGLIAALLRARQSGRDRLRVGATVAAAVALVVAVIAALPVAVSVATNGQTTATARCGLDTFIAGYPDYAVQSACRSHYGSHFAVTVTAAALCVVAISLLVVSRRRDETENWDGPYSEVPA